MRLPDFFMGLCGSGNDSVIHADFHSFTEIFPVMFDYMNRHSDEASKALGKNRVSEMVFERLRFSQCKRYPVMILGDSRIGKTKSVSTWCAMRPGVARLVTIPDTNREWEFFSAHADALGICYNESTSARNLKCSVEAVLRNSGLFIVYDEFHFVLPRTFSKNTPPRRLDWIRSQVIDRGIGCAFCSTRQTYSITRDKYVQTTQYQMEQWIGRIAPPLILPTQFDVCDMESAARAQFPGVDEEILVIIVERCSQKQSGFQYLRVVSDYAQYLADRDGRKDINMDDVNLALKEMLAGAQNVPRNTTAQPERKLRQGSAKPCNENFSRKKIPLSTSETSADISMKIDKDLVAV